MFAEEVFGDLQPGTGAHGASARACDRKRGSRVVLCARMRVHGARGAGCARRRVRRGARCARSRSRAHGERARVLAEGVRSARGARRGCAHGERVSAFAEVVRRVRARVNAQGEGTVRAHTFAEGVRRGCGGRWGLGCGGWRGGGGERVPGTGSEGARAHSQRGAHVANGVRTVHARGAHGECCDRRMGGWVRACAWMWACPLCGGVCGSWELWGVEGGERVRARCGRARAFVCARCGCARTRLYRDLRIIGVRRRVFVYRACARACLQRACAGCAGRRVRRGARAHTAPFFLQMRACSQKVRARCADAHFGRGRAHGERVRAFAEVVHRVRARVFPEGAPSVAQGLRQVCAEGLRRGCVGRWGLGGGGWGGHGGGEGVRRALVRACGCTRSEGARARSQRGQHVATGVRTVRAGGVRTASAVIEEWHVRAHRARARSVRAPNASADLNSAAFRAALEVCRQRGPA